MLQQLLDTIARQPAVWDAFRSVAEFGFTADYKVIERELSTPLVATNSDASSILGVGPANSHGASPLIATMASILPRTMSVMPVARPPIACA